MKKLISFFQEITITLFILGVLASLPQKTRQNNILLNLKYWRERL